MTWRTDLAVAAVPALICGVAQVAQELVRTRHEKAEATKRRWEKLIDDARAEDKR